MSSTTPALLRLLLLLLFTVSGFSGLIYESVWSHYLKLIMGHAAYAQTLVLAIFMGGMTLGAYLASRYSEQWKSPLLVYALIEGVIGLLALAFHPLFIRVIDTLYSSLLLHLEHPAGIYLLKWCTASGLILPQSILLGMTFPSMSAGLIRLYPQRTGASLGVLYFTNSIGAALGVLVSGFALIPWIGLPGAIQTAGILNIAIAIGVWALVRLYAERPAAATHSSDATSPGDFAILLLLAALLTGTASFFYEIGWIRMLSLVLGSSTHAFELMLSAFIAGLALGGLWIRRRLDQIGNPLRLAGHVQISMGLFALLTLPLYDSTFDFMSFLLQSLSKTSGGYMLFNIGSHAIALIIMLPATFMAGMTLPLFTYLIIKRGYGEASIGRVYAANTAGAILGVFLAVHFVMPTIGTKGLVGLGAYVDIALGITLLGLSLPNLKKWILPANVGAAVAVLALVVFGVHFDALKMASGVFRYGITRLADDTEVLYHRDGKTATVGLVRNRIGQITLSTNGKAEALVNPRGYAQTPSDEITMVMTAALPLSMHPNAKTVATIGMGSGMTTHTLLGAETLRRVDTIEIEQAVVEAARGFGDFVERAYSDPRSHIHVEDAKTFFSSRNTRYDLIISEPSDPWVSGVASLFSQEFYRYIKNHLHRDGLFVQWLQLYETNLDLVASIFKALSIHFPNYVIFNTDDTNILIIATDGGDLTRLDPWVFSQAQLSQDMARVGIKHLRDLEIRRIGSRSLLQPLFDTFTVPANSDYFPHLSYGAPRSRYLRQDAADLSWLHLAPTPVLEMLGGRAGPGVLSSTEVANFPITQRQKQAKQLLNILLSRKLPEPGAITEKLRYSLQLLKFELDTCLQRVPNDRIVQESSFTLATHTNPYLAAEELDPMWQHLMNQPCYAKLSPSTKDWFTLHRAVAGRDGDAMTKTATTIIEAAAQGQLNQPQLEYLLAAGLSGALGENDRQKMKVFWAKFYALDYFPKTRPQLYLKLLLTLLK